MIRPPESIPEYLALLSDMDLVCRRHDAAGMVRDLTAANDPAAAVFRIICRHLNTEIARRTLTESPIGRESGR